MENLEIIKHFIIKNKKNIIIIAIYILTIITFIISLLIVYKNNAKKLSTLENENQLSFQIEEKSKSEEKQKIIVDVKGAVKNPGIYELEAGKRVSDVINKAGGFTKDANTRYINLSKTLKDEMVIVVYNNKEIKEVLEVKKETPCICENIKNDSCIENGEKENSSLININTATIEELMTLTGIGETKALAIIEYRKTNGNFNNIEDIMKVSGISESTYSKIKDSITIK